MSTKQALIVMSDLLVKKRDFIHIASFPHLDDYLAQMARPVLS